MHIIGRGPIYVWVLGVRQRSTDTYPLLEIPPVVTFYLYDRHVLFRLYKIVGMFL